MSDEEEKLFTDAQRAQWLEFNGGSPPLSMSLFVLLISLAMVGIALLGVL